MFRAIPIIGTGIAIPVLLSQNKKLLGRYLAFYGVIIALFIVSLVWPPKYNAAIGFTFVTWALFVMLVAAMVYHRINGKEPRLKL